MDPIFVERNNDYVLEEEVPILDRLDIIEDRLKRLENKINRCCESSSVSPVFSSVSSGRRSPNTIGRSSPYSVVDPYLNAMERSGNRVFLSHKKAGKRKTRKNKNKRKNKKIRTRRYKK